MGESVPPELAPAERHLRFRPDIEGLRALAIVFVVLYHVGWQRMSGGFLGVDVFFVLSGFLITGLLLDEIGRTGTLSLAHFWARRARRLLPAAAFVTIIVLVLNAVLLSPFEQITHAGTAQAFAAYGSNILFAVRSVDYFAGSASHDPLLHTWSLSVEEQFYLLFAPLLLALAAWSMKRGRPAFLRRFRVATIMLSLVSLAGCLLLVRRFPVISFYALPTRAWEFGVGALTVLGVRFVDRFSRSRVEAISLVALAGLIGSAIFVSAAAGQSLGLVAVLPTLSAAALIFTGASSSPPLVARVLSMAGPRLVGRLSYSWYLWHWPLLVYLRDIKPEASTRLTATMAILALVPAAVTYAVVESPIRFSKRLRQAPMATILAALALAATTYGLGAAAIRHADHVLRTPRFAAVRAAMDSVSIYGNGCQAPLLAVTSPPCRFGPGTNDTTVVLFGDSHAAQWFPMFESIAISRGWTLVNLTKTGCPAAAVSVDNRALGRRYFECETWRAYAMHRIVELRPILVILASVRNYNVVVANGVFATDSTAIGLAAWRDGLATSLAALQPSGARLAVIRDTPVLGFNAPRCLAKHIDTPDECYADAATAIDTVVAAAEYAAMQTVPDVRRLDLNGFICANSRCPAMRDGVVRYRDSNHLAIAFTRSLAPSVSQLLTAVLGPARH